MGDLQGAIKGDERGECKAINAKSFHRLVVGTDQRSNDHQGDT